MPNNSGTQAVTDEKQSITVVDHQAPEKAAGNYTKVVQRVPVRIDFDHPEGQKFNLEGLLKPGLSVEPKVRVR